MKKVYVIGYYGYQNAGDDAMLMGICDELTVRKVPFKFYFKGNSLWKVIRNLIECDIVALGGGTHLRNWGKGWLKQGLRIMLIGIITRLMGKEFHMWNVGIDGDRWEKAARKLCNFISIRDRETFDSAVLMNYEVPNNTRYNIVGVNFTPMYTIYHNNNERDWFSLAELCLNIAFWLKDKPKWAVRFISLNSNKKYSDEIELDDGTVKVIESYFNDRIVEFISYKDNVIETINSIAECSAIFSMRYHGNVFALMAKVPRIENMVPVYPSVSGFNGTVSLEQAKELARKGIKTW